MKKLLFAMLMLSLLLCACGKEEPEPTYTVPILTEIPTTLTEPPAEAEVPTEAATEAATEVTAETEDPASETKAPPMTEPVVAPEYTRGPSITAVVANAKSVNVRSGPSSRSRQVMKLHKGDKVDIYQSIEYGGKRWCRSEDGWICMDYLDLQGDLSQLGPVPGIPGVVEGAQTMNVRAEASAKSEKVGTLSRYDVVFITETTEVNGTKWGRTQDGWVALKYLSLDDTPQDTDVMKSDTAATPTEDLS